MTEHGDGEPGVEDLVIAGKAREGQREFALRIAIMELAGIGDDRPAGAARDQERAGRGRGLGDTARNVGRIGLGDERHVALGDSGFLGGDLLERAAEIGLMVEREAGDRGDQRAVDDVGRVEAAAEPDFEDQGVGGHALEREERRGRGDFEETRLHALGGVDHFGEERGQCVVVDQRPGKPDALVEADEVGAGERVDAVPGGFERGAQEGAGRALAVGPRDMEHRRQAVVRIAETAEQGEDALEAEDVGGVDRRAETVELGLDRGVGGHREIRHYAAFFAFSGAR